MPAINSNIVLFGTSALYGPVALKASPPHLEVSAEIEALRLSQRTGIITLFDSDPDVAVMLQERVVPGTMLRQHVEAGEIDDVQATRIAAGCMKRFWLPDPHSDRLITLNRWFEALYHYQDQYAFVDGPIPSDIINFATRLADQLLATEEERYIVHGDLNPGNILRSRNDAWTVIDPKGLIAERGYDVGQWMLNPYGLHTWPNLVETLDTRLTVLSDVLTLDRTRLWQWSVAHAALSECWTVAEGTIDKEGLHALAILRALFQLPEASR